MKQPMARFTKLIALALAAGSAMTGFVWAQAGGLSMGDKAKKFTLPVSENGEVKMKISGDEATKLSVNRTEIVNMKIELLEQGIPETIITSPRAYFWTQDRRLQTRNGVRIDRGDMLITAKSMEWQLQGDKGTLRRGVTVKLTGFDVGNRQSMSAASKDLGGAIPVPPPARPREDDSIMPGLLDDPEPAAPSVLDPSVPALPGMDSLPSTPSGEDDLDSIFQ
ncbi:MAG: hypothetical protein AAGK14_07930 [Verrucomicrobiota bacterium]